jgi:trehalose 6-phosphate phosphatase
MAAPGLPPAPPWADLAAGVNPALFLDIDGTLLEFEAHPELVRATRDLTDLLESISASLGGAVALISGRPLDDIDRVFAPWQPFAAGGHGAEVRGSGGTRLHQPDGRQLASIRHTLQIGLEGLSGAWIEDKGYGFALHYRNAPEHERAVTSLARKTADASDGALEVQPGVLVQELRPAAFDKGLAVDELMTQEPFAGRRPIVVGDYRTDEFAFEAAHRHGGQSVIVGPRTDTVATYRIRDPEAVREWLTEIPRRMTR